MTSNGSSRGTSESPTGPNRVHVVPSGDGWAAKKPHATSRLPTYRTQQEAIAVARMLMRSEGGGELTVHRPDGRIRDSDTVPPAHDPNPPRDKR